MEVFTMSTETYSRLGKEKKQKIIDSAIDNFARSGYSGTSMEAVAESAGVAKGALYRYFTGKKDLFMLMVDHLVEDIDHYVQEFLKSHSETNVFTTLYDHLVAIYDFQKRFSMHHEVLCNILYQEQCHKRNDCPFSKHNSCCSQLVRGAGNKSKHPNQYDEKERERKLITDNKIPHNKFLSHLFRLLYCLSTYSK
jgi:hypothetical protein